MQYKDEMRRLIDIVKQQSLNAPLVQTLDDLKTMTNAVKDLSDRVEMRVRKSLTADTKIANKKASKKKAKKSKAIKPFPSIKPNNTQQQTQQTTTPSSATNSLPTNNNISDMRNDFVQKQQALQPIKPSPSF